MKRLAKAILSRLGYEVRKKTEPLGQLSDSFLSKPAEVQPQLLEATAQVIEPLPAQPQAIDPPAFPSDPFEAQRQFIEKLNKTNISILDIGANKGQTAKKYRSLFPIAEIYCFEPFPESIAELKKEFAVDEKIHIIPKAVAEEKGTATFYVNEYDATNSLLPRPTADRRYYPKFAGPKETIEVEITDLDSFLRESNISSIDILKLDIQGGELKALQGAKSLLETGAVSLIYTEIMFIPHYESSPLFHEIWSFLSQFGYSLFDIYDLHRATNGQIRYGDALFVSESVRKNVINQYPEEA